MNHDAYRILLEIRELELRLETEFVKLEAAQGTDSVSPAEEDSGPANHEKHRTPLGRYLLTAHPLVVLTAPLIYGLIIPFVIMDLASTLYQAVCFRVYGIPQVPRASYFAFDRARLPYLNALEKLNCAYCSYVNGVIGYIREIAARTEQFWCPIKHGVAVRSPHARQSNYGEYGDSENYHRIRRELQNALRSE